MDELKRNGSGYYDPTAYKAMKRYEREEEEMEQVINKGEIWEVEYGYERKMALVLAVHEGYCSVLCLNDDDRDTRDIYINARGMKSTESGMVSYKFTKSFMDFVRTTTEAEFADVMEKVADRLNIGGDTAGRIVNENALKLTIKRMKEENEILKEQVEELQKKLDNDSFGSTIIKLTIERDLYKQQYEMLLERLIGA